jgi:hypothetical protein
MQPLARLGRTITPAIQEMIANVTRGRITQFWGELVTSGTFLPGAVDHTLLPKYLPVIRGALDGRFKDFAFQRVEFNTTIPNPITGEDEPGMVMVAPGPRDRLLQMLEQCPKDSYGYYMLPIFRGAHFVVGNFSAAQIDEVFGNVFELLCEPFTKDLAQQLGEVETEYWRSQDGMEWLAGKLLNANGRATLVDLSGRIIQAKEDMKTWWNPTRKE